MTVITKRFNGKSSTTRMLPRIVLAPSNSKKTRKRRRKLEWRKTLRMT